MELLSDVSPEQSNMSSTPGISTSVYYSEYILFSLHEKFFFFLQSTVPISKSEEYEINMVLHTKNAQHNGASKFHQPKITSLFSSSVIDAL